MQQKSGHVIRFFSSTSTPPPRFGRHGRSLDRSLGVQACMIFKSCRDSKVPRTISWLSLNEAHRLPKIRRNHASIQYYNSMNVNYYKQAHLASLYPSLSTPPLNYYLNLFISRTAQPDLYPAPAPYAKQTKAKPLPIYSMP
jgi:hypothetical protein